MLSSRIRLATVAPSPEASPRGDPDAFVAQTRDALQRFPGMATPSADSGENDVAASVESIFWYHTIELPNGIVTKGIFDHRPLVPLYGLPDDLRDKRVLDVGTWDGFWAFELERRGGVVTAIDVEGLHQVDIPEAYRKALDRAGLKEYYGVGFGIARRALGSSVERKVISVYDVNPDAIGLFDFVHMGDLTLHLEYPTKALRAVRSVTRESALIVVPFEPELSGSMVRYVGGWSNVVWWLPSLDTAAQMILDAGFSSAKVHAAYELVDPTAAGGTWRAIFSATV